MATSTLRDMYADVVCRLWSAETQLVVAMARMARSASVPLLRQMLTTQSRQVDFHVRRLEWMCEGLGVRASSKRCVGMAGLVLQVRAILGGDYSADILDAAISASATQITQYKVGSYAAAATWARALGYQDQAALHDHTLLEESQVRETLQVLAAGLVPMMVGETPRPRPLAAAPLAEEQAEVVMRSSA